MSVLRLALAGALFSLLPNSLVAQSPAAPIVYRLHYAHSGDAAVSVSLEFTSAIPAPATFVMPRNYPGGYALVPYDSFVERLYAHSSTGESLSISRDVNGPRWEIGRAGQSIAKIEYQVDVQKMEKELLSAVDSSKVRPQYAGILGYSVFGYVDGFEDRNIDLHVEAPQDWPVLSTLTEDPRTGSIDAQASHYYALADSQILMGPALQVRRVSGKIPLVVAVYAEGSEDIEIEGRFARQALDGVQSYFGTTPFRQYTVQLELLRPLPGHDYGFSQEHLDSGTFSFSTERAITPSSDDRERQSALFNYAHHMAHCWIPKRAYGVGYLPFTWELPPVIDTIWFNEGFGRYAAIEAVAEAMPANEAGAFRERQLAGLRRILKAAPNFIQQMPLLTLSREASFTYTRDFRIGQNVFARGALMAAEIDDRIREQTHGKKSLRDALRFLVERTQQTQKPFETEELSAIFRQATGVDVEDVFRRWMGTPPV